jgi:hypothetical protein
VGEGAEVRKNGVAGRTVARQRARKRQEGEMRAGTVDAKERRWRRTKRKRSHRKMTRES